MCSDHSVIMAVSRSPRKPPSPERTLAVLRALHTLAEPEPGMADMKETLERFADMLMSTEASRDVLTGARLRNVMRQWAQRNQNRIHLAIERGLGG